MDATENKQLLQHAFAQIERGDSGPFRAALADDVRWINIGTTPWSGTFTGKQAVVDELLAPLRTKLVERTKVIAHRFIAADDYVVVEGVGQNMTKAGKPYNNTYCWVCRLADGRITEITEYCDTDLVRAVLGDRKVG